MRSGPGLNKWILLALVFGAAVLLDQTAKFWAVDRLTSAFESRGAVTTGEKLHVYFSLEGLEPYRKAPLPVVQSFWHMKYVENPGAAWGLFQGLPERVRNGFFVVISLAAVAFIVHYFRKLEARQRWLQVGLALVLGGAVGNFIDRLARHYVIDFIDWHWLDRPNLHWPTFNVADACICVGVAILILDPGKRRRAAPAEAESKSAGNKPA